jgi:amino acid transporter
MSSLSGPVVMLWSWIFIGCFTLLVVFSLGEICCAYPTMGALYYWAYRLGGETWGPFSSWMAGWTNLLGQIAGVASGGYSGAEVLGDIATLTTGVVFTPQQTLAVYAGVLIFAAIVNTFAEQLLTRLCSISVVWHIVGTVVIVALMVQNAPTLQTASYVATNFNNATPIESSGYVVLLGCLAAASTFTGYDTSAHVAEETSDSHCNAPYAMIGSVVNCLFLGLLLIAGLNYCIQDIDSLIDPENDYRYALDL